MHIPIADSPKLSRHVISWAFRRPCTYNNFHDLYLNVLIFWTVLCLCWGSVWPRTTMKNWRYKNVKIRGNCWRRMGENGGECVLRCACDAARTSSCVENLNRWGERRRPDVLENEGTGPGRVVSPFEPDSEHPHWAWFWGRFGPKSVAERVVARASDMTTTSEIWHHGPIEQAQRYCKTTTGRPGRVVSHTESTSRHGIIAHKESRHNTVRRGSFASPTLTVTPHPQKQTATYRSFRRVYVKTYSKSHICIRISVQSPCVLQQTLYFVHSHFDVTNVHSLLTQISSYGQAMRS